MFKEVFIFELIYRKGRAATYVYFALIFLISFFTVTSPTLKIYGAVGQVSANAPYVISYLTVVFSFLFTIITSAVMGVAIVRDFENNTEAILFTTPLKKAEYLFGRFAGSFVVLILINSATIIGMMSGFALGKHLPWEVAWHNKEVLPFMGWHYIQPFLLFTVVNIFTLGAIFFVSGALWRNSLIIYSQGIILLILYQISVIFVSDLDSRQLASIIDPFGLQTFRTETLYWTPAEQNSRLLLLRGDLLFNRLSWMLLGVGALVFAYKAFSFNVVRNSFFRNKGTHAPETIKPESVTFRYGNPMYGLRTSFNQLYRLSFFYFKLVWKEIPFLAIVISGIMLLLLSASKVNQIYGTSSYPTTHTILTLLTGSFNLFFIMIAVFYSGELIWKERSVKINLIIDVIPIPDFVRLSSKFIGLVLVYISILLILMVCGIGIQSWNGYYDFNLPVYFGTLFTQTLIGLALFSFLSMFVQVLVNNKVLGFAISVIILIVTSIVGELGLEHSLWKFGSGSLGVFSDMNAYGHFVTPFSWLKAYWLAFSVVLFIISIVFSSRGVEDTMRERWKAGKLRLTRPLVVFAFGSVCLFGFSGFYIYYNTTILNTFEKSSQQQSKRARYEQIFKKFDGLEQPRIVEVNVKVELYPSQRDFTVEGYYYLKNKSTKFIRDIHIQSPMDNQLHLGFMQFERDARLKESSAEFRYHIYELKTPLFPGDSVRMDFKLTYETNGFVEGRSNTDIVYNGTFLSNAYFPGLGYDKNFDLIDDDLRVKYGLKDLKRLPRIDDPRAKKTNLFGDDADHIRFEAQIGTERDQIAIAPGQLITSWEKDGRSFYHYKMKKPMSNFYSIVSARYAVKKDNWNGVNLEIYHHPGHDFNLDRMMDGMKDALSYYSRNFSPFQFDQLRIMEFPRYSAFAQSFANTIPFSEGLGFILKMDNPKNDLDMVYYLTAHEVAHQWWGHQVMEGEAQGNALLSEGLSQYSALMVLKRTFSPEILQKYLKYELDNYIKGRARERKREQPLNLVERQPYIHYNKASLIFYALQDYIGEDSVNAAIRRYNKRWAYRESPYPTSNDLIEEIRKVTPDSLQYIIEDMFERITLFENKISEAWYEEKASGEYEVTLNLSTEKIYADSIGVEERVPVNDWIDVGIYSEDDVLIYLRKHKFTKKDSKLTIVLKVKPAKAGLDPLHKLIDRHTEDNTTGVRKIFEITNLPVQ